MEPWYKVVVPRKEVREGRSFSPDEFAIALEQVVAGTAPEDYRDPEQFFARTCWTRALSEHARLVLRRLSGETSDTAPVLTLITQFGGGKTHTLTALYHLARSGARASRFPGVAEMLRGSGLSSVPEARVGVFVGNAWDPQPGRETPWIDLAWQVAGEKGVKALGDAAREKPPGTEALGRIFEAANAPVLLLFDEVLNFINRHRDMADAFHAFVQNLTVATTGATGCAAVISLPRSQVEMSGWDVEWQERIAKVVRRVAKDLIVNDEAEISEVVRRRLFEDLGDERVRKKVAGAYAKWCFERRAQLPPEWTTVDTAISEAKASRQLRAHFEGCYPFHPATLSVFRRKWQTLPQYQQTRGTLAMLAQWIAWAYREGFTKARREPLITLGSAPLSDPGFRGAVLGQLGETRLEAAIEADIAGERSHASALDADTKGPLRDIHRRVGAAILFESSGGQTDRVARLPELRFALGEPQIDTTSVDTAALRLAEKAYYIRRVGTDGFRIGHRPTVRKVVNDRKASLDEDNEILPALRKLVSAEFRDGMTLPVIDFPTGSSDVPDNPKLTFVLVDPALEWTGDEALRAQIADWTRRKGDGPRLYPGALVWCVKKPGRELREKVEEWLAWERVARELQEGVLGVELDRAEAAEIKARVDDAKDAAREEVWASYRFIVLADATSPGGLRVVDLGAGHSSSNETLRGRVIAALKAEELLNETVGAGYIERHWPPAFQRSGAWPLQSLRQSFLDGSLTRLLDPEGTLRGRIVEFVERGDFGLAWGERADGTYERVCFRERVDPADVSFERDVFLLRRERADVLKRRGSEAEASEEELRPESEEEFDHLTVDEAEQSAVRRETVTIRMEGEIRPEVWNRLGTRLVPRLRAGIAELRLGVRFTVAVDAAVAASTERDIRQILDDLGLSDRITVAVEQASSS